MGLQASTATQHEGGTRMGGRAGVRPPCSPTLVSTGSREELSLGPPPAETGLPVSPPPLPLLESAGPGEHPPPGGLREAAVSALLRWELGRDPNVHSPSPGRSRQKLRTETYI